MMTKGRQRGAAALVDVARAWVGGMAKEDGWPENV